MRVRRIGPGFADWEALLALIRSAFAGMEGRIDPPSSAQALSVAALQAKAGAEIGLLALDEREGLIGCLFCRPDAAQSYLALGKLAVAPGHQRQGVGRALITAAADLAAQQGLAALCLQTRIELVENHAAFTALGFVRTAEGRHPGYERTTFIEMRRPVLR